MQKNGFNVLVVTSPWDMQYFIGFQCTLGTLFITPESVVLLTDYRYVRYAKAECEFLEAIDMAKDTSPDALYKRLSSAYTHPVFGFDDTAPYSTVQFFINAAPAALWRPFGNLVAELRAVKDEDEIKCIARACEITDIAFTQILEYIKPGRKELDVSIEIERIMKQNGADQPMGYNIIVASGLRSTYSHGRAGNKIIQKNDIVLMDFGCKYQEYCSDFTRTIFMGKASEQQKEVYSIVEESQELCTQALADGITNFEIHNIARNNAARYGYEEFCGNGAGHSLGLAILELPILTNTGVSDDCYTLRVGNVVTIEPTIYYVPGEFGVRIEDMLHITADGAYNFYKSTKELTELGW
jgi:Xaa-Pro aminopeptidase